MPDLTPKDIDAVCDLVNDLCGIYWDESKEYLIEARLKNLVTQNGCEHYWQLANKVRAKVVPGLDQQIIDAVTTNETLWFRDSSPFDAIQFKLLPEIIDEKANTVFPKRIRIWSAACSTGQEAYSIAMTIAELLYDYQTWDIQILGTDISPSAVEQASRGVYNKWEIGRGMTPEFLNKYFDQPDPNTWKIKDEIRSMCNFKVCNLFEPFTGMGPFDIVFCRNVAIYFTPKDRRAVFERIAEKLNPSGWLLVGSSESLVDLGPEWQPQHHCRANCYRPKMTMVTL